MEMVVRMKKGQIEMVGLLVIVVLIVIIALFAFGYMLRKGPSGVNEFNSIKANNLMNALTKTSVCEPGEIMEDIMVACCENRDMCRYALGGEVCCLPINIALKVDFTAIENTGAGDMAPVIFVGPDREEYEEGEWIPLVDPTGEMIVDGGMVKDVPGLAFERGNGWIRIHLHGHYSGSAGWEKAYGRLTFRSTTFTEFIDDKAGGKVENQGDGIWADDYNQDEVVYTLGSNVASFYLTVDPHDDGFYLKYECDNNIECGPVGNTEPACDYLNSFVSNIVDASVDENLYFELENDGVSCYSYGSCLEGVSSSTVFIRSGNNIYNSRVMLC